MSSAQDLLIGIDAGTSVVKAVAFDLSGKQIAVASVPNRYTTTAEGAAYQSLDQTWADCAQTLRDLASRVDNLARRTRAIAVTGQGDGTWLVGAGNRPAADAWLWLDARAASTVRRLQASPASRARFEATGTGLAACSQGAQIAHMASVMPDVLDRTEVALHCKDWLYLNLTGVRATDPSEASFTYGNFRTRRYDDSVIEALGLSSRRGLLPEIIDGTQVTHGLSAAAASATGLLEGTPVCLGFVDIVLTALGAGIYTADSAGASCSIVGSTGMHMRAEHNADIHLSAEGTGYVIPLPVPGMSAQVQSNMAATLNIDWVLNLACDLLAQFGTQLSHSDRMKCVDTWLQSGRAGALLYHPYISDAGERGPFVDPHARADFIGLTSESRFPDLVRAVVEGLGMAARDCYAAMGGAMPRELRLTGGATRSRGLRGVLGAVVGAPVRISTREEAGAAGAAMMAAVALGIYPDMHACIAQWVTPLLGQAEQPEPELIQLYTQLFPAYRQARRALEPIWDEAARVAQARRVPQEQPSEVNVECGALK